MEIARWNRTKRQRYGLVGEICPKGHKVFPPRDICPDCGKEAKTPYQFSGKGEVHSFTIVRDAPEGHVAPYAVALIKLEEGPLVTAQLTDVDNDQVQIGMPVEMVTRKLREDGHRGMLVYSYKFRPPITPSLDPPF